ncbi:hypothetical protein F4677DRAFT_466008 [Hypoxylon crocopeplum]|nr:hypothetical protein F4677DRAFT_466008 [Hypoxylon crocopeplum]
MAYSNQAKDIFNHMIYLNHAGIIGNSATTRRRVQDANATSKSYLLSVSPGWEDHMRRFVLAIADPEDGALQDALFCHLTTIAATIDKMAECSIAKLSMFQAVLEEVMNCDGDFRSDGNATDKHGKCCYFEIQEYCHRAFVTTPSAANSESVVDLSEAFVEIYKTCCSCLWQDIAWKRWLDLEEAAEELVDLLVDQVAEELGDEQFGQAYEEDGEYGDYDEEKEYEEDEEEAHRPTTGLRGEVEDCKCLVAVWEHQLGPTNYQKHMAKVKRIKAQVARRRRLQGLPTKGDKLEPSPLSRPPLTFQP